VYFGTAPVLRGRYASDVEGQNMDRRALRPNDVVVSKVLEGHLLLVMTDTPGEPLSLLFRGTAWNVQYAVARGARLASIKGGNLWYTTDRTATLEYLATFRAGARVHPS
jgi:hypothetical protein